MCALKGSAIDGLADCSAVGAPLSSPAPSAHRCTAAGLDSRAPVERLASMPFDGAMDRSEPARPHMGSGGDRLHRAQHSTRPSLRPGLALRRDAVASVNRRRDSLQTPIGVPDNFLNTIETMRSSVNGRNLLHSHHLDAVHPMLLWRLSMTTLQLGTKTAILTMVAFALVATQAHAGLTLFTGRGRWRRAVLRPRPIPWPRLPASTLPLPWAPSTPSRLRPPLWAYFLPWLWHPALA
jgi:hypothetical protein